MTCKHCESNIKDLSGNKISYHTECDTNTCTITESPCLCTCHYVEGAKEYNDI